MLLRPPRSTLFPTRRSSDLLITGDFEILVPKIVDFPDVAPDDQPRRFQRLALRSEEHTSELQSQSNLVCRLLLEKIKYYFYPFNIQTTFFIMKSFHLSVNSI